MNVQLASLRDEERYLQTERVIEFSDEMNARKKWMVFHVLFAYATRKMEARGIIHHFRARRAFQIQLAFFQLLQEESLLEKSRARESKLRSIFSIWKIKVQEKLALARYMEESAALTGYSEGLSLSERDRMLSAIIPSYQMPPPMPTEESNSEKSGKAYSISEEEEDEDEGLRDREQEGNEKYGEENFFEEEDDEEEVVYLDEHPNSREEPTQ